MRSYWMLTKSGLRAFRRDRQGLFWSFFFPVMFIMIFGLIFSGDRNGKGPRFPIGLVSPDNSPAAAWVPDVFKSVPAFEIKTGSESDLCNELAAGKLRAVVIFPPDFGARVIARETSGVRVLSDPTQQISQTVVGIVQQVLAGMQQRMTDSPPLIRPVVQTVAPDAEQAKSPRPIDYLVPGILAMSIMQLGLFTAIPIINMREKGILKRLRATPLPRSALVGSQITQRMFISLMQTAVILGLGGAVFKFHVAGSWLALIALVIFGVTTFICLGAVLSAYAKTQETGISLVQMVNMPMMFLSGIFWPPEIMPSFMKPVMSALPATYMADALRHVTMAAPSAYSVTTDVGVLAAWLAGCVLVAIKTFRWE